MLSKIYLGPEAIAGDYVFDADRITFNGTNPKLKNNRPAALTAFAHFNGGNADLNYSRDGGSVAAVAHGGTVLTDGALTLDSGHWMEYAGLNNIDAAIQTGTIEISRTPNYSGAPSALVIMLSIFKGSGDYSNLIDLRHNTDGTIGLFIFSSTQTQIVGATLPVWSPVAGTKYRFSLNYDLTTGSTRLFINGVQFGATQTGTGTRDSNIGLLYLGQGWPGSGFNDNALIDDFEIYDTVQHTANYTPEDFPDFIDSSPSIKGVVVNASALISFSPNSEKQDGTDVRFTIEVNGVEYWFESGGWVESSGPEESNPTFTEVQLSLLDLNGFSAVRPVGYLMSDGGATPTLFSFIIGYLGHGLAEITGYMLNPDGTIPEGGRVRIGLTTLVLATGANVVVNKQEILASVGDLGLWTASLIVGGTYAFNFERIVNGVRSIDGKLIKAITSPGPVLFQDL